MEISIYLIFRNAMPLCENERKIIEEALKDGKDAFLDFHYTAPFKLQIKDNYRRTSLVTFYLKEPFNFDIRIE